MRKTTPVVLSVGDLPFLFCNIFCSHHRAFPVDCLFSIRACLSLSASRLVRSFHPMPSTTTSPPSPPPTCLLPSTESQQHRQGWAGDHYRGRTSSPSSLSRLSSVVFHYLCSLYFLSNTPFCHPTRNLTFVPWLAAGTTSGQPCSTTPSSLIISSIHIIWLPFPSPSTSSRHNP